MYNLMSTQTVGEEGNITTRWSFNGVWCVLSRLKNTFYKYKSKQTIQIIANHTNFFLTWSHVSKRVCECKVVVEWCCSGRILIYQRPKSIYKSP